MRTRHALSLQVACMLDEQQALQFFFLFLLNKRKFPRVIELCFSCSRLRSSGTSLRKLSTEKGNRDCPEKTRGTSKKYLLFFYAWISLKALHNWSGQDVHRFPHLIPSRRAITSSTFIPFTNREIPWRLPLHPPQKNTCLMIPSSTSNSIWLLQVPWVL